MIKRTLPIVLILSILLSYLNVYAESISFPDLSPDHWAYSSVMALVADGTIRGYEDGEFKPNNTVSRAEFVKMIGKGNVKREDNFADVPESHWSYDYIMYSELDGEGDYFYPDTPITRHDVAQLVWKRAGAATEVIAPTLITSQGQNSNAIAWVYAYGIMIGDDGVNLRLHDTLTRAEAATLIIRSRQINSSSKQIDFINTVDEKIFETTFNSAKLFDNLTYNPSQTITNGEMARAAVRLGSEEYNLSYLKYSVEEPFEHEYSKDLYAIGKYCIGEDKINKEFINKKATIRDTLTALTYNAIKKSHKALEYGDKNNYYNEIGSVNTDIENICLTFAYNNGISLYANGRINPDKEITMKEFAAILLQLDAISGINSAVVIGEKTVKKNTPLQTDLNSYPNNANLYQSILKEIPKSVYEKPFVNIKDASKKITGVPKENFDFAREFGFIFTNMLNTYKNYIQNTNNVQLQFTYYPTLACDNGNGYTIRIKCEILQVPGHILLKDVFKISDNVNGNLRLTDNMEFYADFNTGQPVKDQQIPYNNVTIDQIVYIGQ